MQDKIEKREKGRRFKEGEDRGKRGSVLREERKREGIR